MHIESVQIENYKSFLERRTFNFEPGFNLLVGANNAGKTTVLDVIDLEPGLNEPHRSVRTIPAYGGQPSSPSSFEVVISTRFGELRQLAGWTQVYLPVIQQVPGGTVGDEELLQQVHAFVVRDGDLRLRGAFGNGTSTTDFGANESFLGKIDVPIKEARMLASLEFGAIVARPTIRLGNHSPGAQSTVASYFQCFRQRIYRFDAQRRPGSECGASASLVLDRQAESLPYCVNHLQTTDPHGHEMLCAWVKRVFPNVLSVRARPVDGRFQLRCYFQPDAARRDDLATPMARMGAGIGNVIAIFYVVLTSRYPQAIAIDEPNAFLHPRALRELLAILESEGQQHQFILTAHSADVLTAVRARTISLLELDGVVTKVKQVGAKSLHSLRGELADLGIRVTDLHAKDRVLWVEGQTEELVMPDLLRYACPEVAGGTAVLRVERTGSFCKKSIEPQEVAHIYERLSSSSAMVPPMVCILLDGESRSLDDRIKITTESKGRLRFLDLRMLENYLLDAEAMAAVLDGLGHTTTLAIVQDALSVQLRRTGASDDLSQVDGASTLASVFTELSSATIEFRKTRDVPELVAWLLDNRPAHLAPLRACLRAAFDLPPT